MTFDEVLARVLDLLQRQGRVSYRALKRRFDLDDDYLEDLKAEIIKAHHLVRDEAGGVVWTGSRPCDDAYRWRSHEDCCPWLHPVTEERLGEGRVPLLWQPQGEHNAARQMVLETSSSLTATGIWYINLEDPLHAAYNGSWYFPCWRLCMHPDPNILDDLVQRIVEVAHPRQIILFGSAARGEMGPQSDIDVLVVVPDGTHCRHTAQTIYQHLIGLGVSVDVVVATDSDLQQYGQNFSLVYYPALHEGRAIYAA